MTVILISTFKDFKTKLFAEKPYTLVDVDKRRKTLQTKKQNKHRNKTNKEETKQIEV